MIQCKAHLSHQFLPRFAKQRISDQSVTTDNIVTNMGADRNGPFPCLGSALVRSMTFPSMKYQVTIACTNAVSNVCLLYCTGLQ